MVAVLSGNAPLRGLTFCVLRHDVADDRHRSAIGHAALDDGLPLSVGRLAAGAAYAWHLRIARTLRSRHRPYGGGSGRAESARHQDRHAARRPGLPAELVPDSALLMDRLGHGRHSGHRRFGDRLDFLRPCAAHRKGCRADVRHRRRAWRHRRRKRHQRPRRRRAGTDRRVRRAVQRRHGDPARRLSHPRPRSRAGNADQASRPDLFDGVEHRHRQHSRLRPLLRVQRPAREDRDAALHAVHAGGAQPRSISAPSKHRGTGATFSR